MALNFTVEALVLLDGGAVVVGGDPEVIEGTAAPAPEW